MAAVKETVKLARQDAADNWTDRAEDVLRKALLFLVPKGAQDALQFFATFMPKIDLGFARNSSQLQQHMGFVTFGGRLAE